MSFQGDFPLRPEERGTYEAAPGNAQIWIAIGILPLLYGLYLLLYPLIVKGGVGTCLIRDSDRVAFRHASINKNAFTMNYEL